jgi:hypothetical protein
MSIASYEPFSAAHTDSRRSRAWKGGSGRQKGRKSRTNRSPGSALWLSAMPSTELPNKTKKRRARLGPDLMRRDDRPDVDQTGALLGDPVFFEGDQRRDSPGAITRDNRRVVLAFIDVPRRTPRN